VTSPATPPTTNPGGPGPTTPPTTTTPTTTPRPTTTRPPGSTTTAPPPTTPPSTTPPSTTPPLPPPGDPVDNGPLGATLVNPRYGSTQGGDRIEIQGHGFRGTMFVLFGSIPGASVSVVSSTSLLVTTPAHVAGTVDLRISIQGGSSLVFGSAFTYRAPDPSGSVPTPGAPVPTTTPAATTPPSTTPGPTSPVTTAPGPSTTTAPDGGAGDGGPPTVSPTRFTFAAEQTINGLRVREVSGGPALAPGASWTTRACRTVTCPAQRT
jgi:hypothetical protein